MANRSMLKLSRSAYLDSSYSPPLFLAPALQSLRLTTSHYQSPSQTQTHAFSTTPTPQIRNRSREKNKSRSVSAIRRTGPRVPLSISKYPLPEPNWAAPLRKEFKARDDHGLWGFFNEKKTAMTAPEDLNAHGRSWTYTELASKSWDDLWRIWWVGVRERNWLATEANERNRVKAGYGDYEGEEREKTIRKTMFTIKNVLLDRSKAFEEACQITSTKEFWLKELGRERRRLAHQQNQEDADLVHEQQQKESEQTGKANVQWKPIA